MITIDEFMTSDPYALGEDNTVEDARKVMTEKHIRHIPITDDNHRLLGLVTQRDILAATGPETESRDSRIRLGDIMISDVSSVSRNDSLRRAAMYLQSHKYGCLPVLSDDRLVGIITDTDFIAIAVNLLEQVEISEEEVDFDDSMDDIDFPEYEKEA